ncbi:hypothetical protein L7F22_037205 [Adiantum nelumboides]|nr:hypothetical protein [Adiantum nelumboides]
MADEERPPSPPPLLAYTVSQQQANKGKGKTVKKSKSVKQVLPPNRRKRATEPVLFDEDARREFLTGFRKRKQARIETVKKKALEREKEERRQSRAETRKARLEQAAENVRMEKIAYGNGEDEDEDEDEEVEEDQREQSPSAYETEEHHTTVTVQEWNPEEEEDAERLVKEKAAAKIKKLQDSLPPSSRRAAKKLKSATKQPVTKSAKNLTDARKISKLLDAEETIEVPQFYDHNESGTKEDGKDEDESNGKKKKSSKFYYESKLERAKAKAKIKEKKLKWAERRKEERLEANKHDRNRMRKVSKRKKKK